jgi:hypothetical protein
VWECPSAAPRTFQHQFWVTHDAAFIRSRPCFILECWGKWKFSLDLPFQESFLYKTCLSTEYRKLQNHWRAFDQLLRLLSKTMLWIHLNKRSSLGSCPFSPVVSLGEGQTTSFQSEFTLDSKIFWH